MKMVREGQGDDIIITVTILVREISRGIVRGGIQGTGALIGTDIAMNDIVSGVMIGDGASVGIGGATQEIAVWTMSAGDR